MTNKRKLMILIVVIVLIILGAIIFLALLTPVECKLTIHYVGYKKVPLRDGWIDIERKGFFGWDSVATGFTNTEGKITFILPKGIYRMRILGGKSPNEVGPSLGRWGGFHKIYLYFDRTIKVEAMQGY